MFSSDNFLFIVLFTVPGAIYLLFNKYVRPIPKVERDQTARLSSALLFSFVVFGLNLIILRNGLSSFIQLKSVFDDVGELLKVLAADIIIGFIVAFLWAAVGKRLFLLLINLINKLMKRPVESENSILFNDVFETDKFFDRSAENIVTIEKDGLKTSGVLKYWTPDITGRCEFILQETDEIERYLRNDETLSEEDKIFLRIKFVYFDTSNELKITFYDRTKYDEWCKSSVNC